MRAFNGQEFKHDIIVHPGAAVIIPVLPGEKFVMIRQFRTAIRKVIYEFPAGTLEVGEAPLECAKREIIEETGFEAKTWKKLCTFYPAPGVSTELMYIFIAKHLTPKTVERDTDEFLEREVVPFKRLKKMIENGTIMDAKTIVGFFQYCTFKRR